MPVDREKVAATMVDCDSYSGWAAKYMRGDFDFRDLWNEVKGTTIEKPLNPEKEPEEESETVPEEVTSVPEGESYLDEEPGPNG